MIELLSPSNKRLGGDREQFLAKRQQILNSNVHLVEIDLLRGGPRLPIADLPECDYYVMVSQVDDRPNVGLWPVDLREPLPEIPVPLMEADEEVALHLQEALQRAYDAAGYRSYIYSSTPDPPLPPADARWAAELLRHAGVRVPS